MIKVGDFETASYAFPAMRNKYRAAAPPFSLHLVSSFQHWLKNRRKAAEPREGWEARPEKHSFSAHRTAEPENGGGAARRLGGSPGKA